MAKLESCIFGLGCTSLNNASSTYIKWLQKNKMKLPKADYVASPAAFVKKNEPRLLFVDGVSTLFHILPLLGDNDRVIVSDSPVLLDEIPFVPVLDLVINPQRQWSFTIKPFDPKDFHKRLERSYKRPLKPSSLNWKRKDQLGLLVENNAAGVIATPYKSVMGQLDHTDRTIVRKNMAAWADNKLKLEEFDRVLKGKMKAGTINDSIRADLIEALTQHQSLVHAAMPLLAKNRSVNSLIKGKPVTLFELKFIYKLVSNSTAE